MDLLQLATGPFLVNLSFADTMHHAEGLQNGLKQVERLTAVKRAKEKQGGLSSAVHAFGAVYAAEAMFSAGLQRLESRGSFFRSDYPAQSAEWRCSIVHHMDKNAVLQSKLCPRPEIT